MEWLIVLGIYLFGMLDTMVGFAIGLLILSVFVMVAFGMVEMMEHDNIRNIPSWLRSMVYRITIPCILIIILIPTQKTMVYMVAGGLGYKAVEGIAVSETMGELGETTSNSIALLNTWLEREMENLTVTEEETENE